MLLWCRLLENTEITVITNISRTPRPIQENFAERPDCLNGISRICWKIDSRANVRTDTQPPGHGSEPHLDFVVTDLDGMLAQPCGPGALGCGQGFRAARLQSNFAVLTSHVSARLGSRQENSAGHTAGADFPGMLKIDCRVNLIVCHDRSPPGGDRP